MSTAIRKKPITRSRESLACVQCKTKKLKCDRQLPCGSCIKRDEQATCSYAKTPGRKDQAEDSRASKAEARLQHLEQLVQDFVHSSESEPSSRNGPSDGAEYQDDAPDGGPTYAGATHYSAMLEGIEELRQILAEEESRSDSSPPSHEGISNEVDVLFGYSPRLPMSVILAQHLPPKQELDRRLAAYFRAEAIAAPFIHIPSFMRQYEGFCEDQMGTNPLWISILFSICSLSRSTGRGAGITSSDGSQNGHVQRNFSLAAAHCLSIGRYSRPQRFAVEALGVYCQAKVIETLDPSRAIGILYGTLIQVAYSMGYHRDPDHFKQFTPFEGEMRRRAWSYCMQLDLLISFQLGLPSNVQFGSWNTRMPSNLIDSDFDEDMLALPPPRPATEPTKITFYLAKHTLMTTFDKILSHALSVGGLKPEKELIALDAELHAAYESVPAVYRYRSIASTLGDPLYLVTTRKCVELMFQKCRCVLHRQHVTAGRQESARVCFEAATALVQAFLELYPEWKPGGQFYDDRWLLGSISWNDFLLGVMVLCLVLCQYKKSSVPDLSTEELRQLVLLLEDSKEVCLEKVDESSGARRTHRLLETLLAQVADSGTRFASNNSESTPTLPMLMSPQSGVMVGDTLTLDRGMPDLFQDVSNQWVNVFDTQEWGFLEDYLNTNFDV